MCNSASAHTTNNAAWVVTTVTVDYLYTKSIDTTG